MKKIKVFHAFTGVDSQLMAEKKVWGDDNIHVVGSMEVDIDAIISCALIHKNSLLHEKLNIEWDDGRYDKAKVWLKERNIGFDFKTMKSKIDRLKKDRLKMLYIMYVYKKLRRY